jgi:glycosyltransferase involved in cell wall biosynthesis
MTHLLIDAVGSRSGGGATVALAVLQAALEHPAIHRVTLTALPPDDRRFTLPEHPRLTVITPPAAAYPARLVWHSAGVGALARAIRADRVLDLNALGHTPGIPRAVLLQQQLVLITPPDSLDAGHRARLWLMRQLTASAASSAALRVAQRPGVARQVEAWLHKPTITLMPHATWPDTSPLYHERDLLDVMARDHNPRILYVGSDLPTKRLDILLAAMRHLRREHPATLYCTLPPSHPMLRGDGIVALGDLSRAAVREAMELATCLVLPSEVETVGLPLVEAMSVGCPCVAPALPYAEEMADGAIDLFRPGDIHALADTLLRLLSSPGRRAALSARGRQRHAALLAQRPYPTLIDLLLAAEAP